MAVQGKQWEYAEWLPRVPLHHPAACPAWRTSRCSQSRVAECSANLLEDGNADKQGRDVTGQVFGV